MQQSENFANYFLKTKAKFKCFLVLKPNNSAKFVVFQFQSGARDFLGGGGECIGIRFIGRCY